MKRKMHAANLKPPFRPGEIHNPNGMNGKRPLLEAAASSAPGVALELEANGLTATPQVVAAVIACVLLKTWKPDEKKRDKLVALLLPLVEREMSM